MCSARCSRCCWTERVRTVAVGWCLAVVVASGLCACAEVGRPSGGPVDQTPPELASVQPGSLQVNVDPRAPLRLEFSEKVDRRRIERGLTLVPPISLEKPRFEEHLVEFRPARDWPADTVVVWSVAPDVPDKHGVRIGTELRGAFTTGSRIPQGGIRGTASLALPGTKETDWTTLRAELDLPLPEGERRRPRWRSAGGDARGSFELEWLDVPSGPFHLTVYLDHNANAKRDEREPVAELDSLFLAEADSILVLDAALLRLIDLEGPVDMVFCLESVLVDSVQVQVWARGEEETRPRTATFDSSGCVVLSLPVGSVLYGAWVDENGDKRFGADSTGLSEAFLWPDTLLVEPARPDTLRMAWPVHEATESSLDSLRVPPVPDELSTDPPRGS